jgi:hypothetical protein
MQRALSFFTAMTEAEVRHENQLTRALLVVLRYSPVAHMAWLRLVAPNESLHALPAPDFRTQRARPVEGLDLEDSEERAQIRGVSVLLTPDVPEVDGIVSASDRAQILDGIIQYGEELVIVIENKIAFGVQTEQPNRINPHGESIEFDEVAPLRWQELLDVMADLVSRELVSGAERMVIADFLDLVEHHFPKVGPYTNLKRCGAARFRIERRLDAVLAMATGVAEGRALGKRVLHGRKRITMAFLLFDVDPARILLRMYPGDTLEQARVFYRDVPAVQRVQALAAKGWSVVPDFHWGALALGVANARHGRADLKAYCGYWVDNIGDTSLVRRPDWEPYWRTLETAGIVGAEDREAFDVALTNTLRRDASPRPGICCEFQWEMDAATRLDSDGARFVTEVRERMDEVLRAVGERAIGDT